MEYNLTFEQAIDELQKLRAAGFVSLSILPDPSNIDGNPLYWCHGYTPEEFEEIAAERLTPDEELDLFEVTRWEKDSNGRFSGVQILGAQSFSSLKLQILNCNDLSV